MRIAAYVGVSSTTFYSSKCSVILTVWLQTSVALAASVLLRAAYERPNFYSACVYLSQSNACLMVSQVRLLAHQLRGVG